jgi:hypothetical protein
VIQLLQNKLIKGVLFALITSVMVFGVFFLSPTNVEAQTAPNFSTIPSSSWIETDTEITDSSIDVAGVIQIDQSGGFIENPGSIDIPRNRFYYKDNLENYLNYILIDVLGGVEKDYIISFFAEIKKNGTLIARVPTSNQDYLGLNNSGNLTANQQRFSFGLGGLDHDTTYTIQIFGQGRKRDIIATSGAAHYPSDGSPFSLGDLKTIQTLALGQNPPGTNPTTGVNDYEGLTGFEKVLNDNISCGWKSVLTNCVVHLLYNVFYAVSSSLLNLAGILFDLLISFAISSKVYNDSTFVISGWSIVRDLSNIFFIFILLAAAFRTMFGSSDVGKTIKNVIVVALLINFSLFMVRVVIDTSNVLAHLFYNRISITGVNNTELPPSIELKNTGTQREISTGITAGLNVQNFLSGKAVEKFLGSNGVKAGTFATIIIFGIIVNLTAAWIFFKVGFMMLGRIIGLWMSMILAPLAFISKLVPGASTHVKAFSFEKWSKDLISYALLAPVFLFFVYLIILFINSHFLDGFLKNAANYSGFEMLIVLSLSFIMIIGLLKMAAKTAEDMSGEAGKMISGAATKAFGAVAGIAGGAAMAGVGFAGRQTFGRGLKALGDSERLKAQEAEGGIRGWKAKQMRNFGKYGAKSSFDARSGILGKGLNATLKASGVEGIDFDHKKLSVIGGDTKSSKGGHEQARKEAEKAALARAKELKIGPDANLSKNVYEKRKEIINANREIEKLKEDGYKDGHWKVDNANTDLKNAKEDLKKAEANKKKADTDRTNTFADAHEEAWTGQRGGGAEQADKIRKTTSGKTNAGKIEDMMKKMAKEGKDDDPDDDNPGGGGNNQNPGGGGNNQNPGGGGNNQNPGGGGPTNSSQSTINDSKIAAVVAGGKPEETSQSERKGKSNPGQYVAKESAERYGRRFGDAAAKDRFKDQSSGDSFEYSQRMRREGERKTRPEYKTIEKPQAAQKQSVPAIEVSRKEPETAGPSKSQTDLAKLTDSLKVGLDESLSKAGESIKEGMKENFADLGESIKESSDASMNQVDTSSKGIEETLEGVDNKQRIRDIGQKATTIKTGKQISESVEKGISQNPLRVVKGVNDDKNSGEKEKPRKAA